MPLPRRVLDAMSRYPAFYQQVWKECAKIPKGRTLTYGELARRLGNPNAARAVGRALGANPFAPLVPCHRVVAADGPGGFSGPGGVVAKLKLLRKERAL